MAKIVRYTKSTRGKEITCGKCHKEIRPGMEYLKATPYRQRPVIRCVSCGLKEYEASGSEFVREAGAIVEEWRENYGITDSTVDEITEALESLRDQAQDSLDNMPEQLQEADTGVMLQERIDMIESVITDLESVDFDEIIEDARDEAIDEIGGEWPEDEVNEMPEWTGKEYTSQEEWEQDMEEAQQRIGTEAFADAIDSALQGLEY